MAAGRQSLLAIVAPIVALVHAGCGCGDLNGY